MTENWRSRAYNAPIYPTPQPMTTPTTTTGPAMTELTDDLKQTVTRLIEIQQTRTELEAEEKHLKTIIRTRLNVGDKGTVNGQPVVALTPNRRFSSELAQQKLPAELLPLCTVTKIDSAAAKKTLPPALYDLCMTEIGEPVVRLV